MREQFRCELTEAKEFFIRGEHWKRWKQVNPAGFYTLPEPRSEGLPRRLSQNNAHWERCTVLGQEVGVSKEKMSDILMECAYITTGSTAYGSHLVVFGKEQFAPASTTSLTVDEFWQLKREAYAKLQFINEDREPENYLRLPERDASGIIAFCTMWEERPRI